MWTSRVIRFRWVYCPHFTLFSITPKFASLQAFLLVLLFRIVTSKCIELPFVLETRWSFKILGVLLLVFMYISSDLLNVPTELAAFLARGIPL